MPNFNRVIIVGHLCRNPEVKYFQSGLAFLENAVAVNDRRKSPSGEWVQETTFIDVTFWGANAENVSKYLHKGDAILIEGRLKQDQWEKDGKKQTRLRVICERFQMFHKDKQADTNDTTYTGGENVHAEYRNAYNNQQSVKNQTEAKPDWTPTPDSYTDGIPF